jgi:cbb3-type cytochrome oxidase maturation protein
MLEYLTLGQFVVAVLMGLAALCAFLWGAASGALSDVEAAKYRVLQVEDGMAGGDEPCPTASRRSGGSTDEPPRA